MYLLFDNEMLIKNKDIPIMAVLVITPLINLYFIITSISNKVFVKQNWLSLYFERRRLEELKKIEDLKKFPPHVKKTSSKRIGRYSK